MANAHTEWMHLQISAKRQEAEGIVSFILSRQDRSCLPPFTAGAHVDVEVAPGLVRQYSLCGSRADPCAYQIAVLREAISRGGSVGLHDRCWPGDFVRVSHPRNHFGLVEDAQHSILLAGGIGVTPILSMADDLQARRASFEMHYAVRTQSRAAFVDRVLSAGGRIYLDDHEAEAELSIESILSTAPRQSHVYVCGPAGFIEAALKGAASIGWPETRLHREFFSPIGALSAPTLAFEIEIRSTGCIFLVGPNESVVEVLERYGIKTPVSCEQGICGSCVTRILAGLPDHRDSVLTPVEHARNDVFTPCCSRALSSRLVLDI
jgi:vanillate O-demethylase ferredoxin subunit